MLEEEEVGFVRGEGIEPMMIVMASSVSLYSRERQRR